MSDRSSSGLGSSRTSWTSWSDVLDSPTSPDQSDDLSDLDQISYPSDLYQSSDPSDLDQSNDHPDLEQSKDPSDLEVLVGDSDRDEPRNTTLRPKRKGRKTAAQVINKPGTTSDSNVDSNSRVMQSPHPSANSVILDEPFEREAVIPYYDDILDIFTPNRDLEADEDRPGSAEEALPLVDKYYLIPNDGQPEDWEPDLELIEENLAEFMRLPVAIGFILRCYITRSYIAYDTVYTLCLENDSMQITLVKAVKTKNKEYHITTDVMSRYAKAVTNKEAFIGRTSRNVNNFAIYDYEKTDDGKSGVFAKLAYVSYSFSLYGSMGQSSFHVAIPGMASESKRLGEDKDKKHQTLKAKHVVHLCNKQRVKKNGRWQELDMGYKPLKSIKNFQLIDPAEDFYVILQMGKLRMNEYSVSFGFPLSPLQAFGIAITRLRCRH